MVPDQVRWYHPLIQEAPVINFHVNIAVTELQNKYLTSLSLNMTFILLQDHLCALLRTQLLEMKSEYDFRV